MALSTNRRSVPITFTPLGGGLFAPDARGGHGLVVRSLAPKRSPLLSSPPSPGLLPATSAPVSSPLRWLQDYLSAPLPPYPEKEAAEKATLPFHLMPSEGPLRLSTTLDEAEDYWRRRLARFSPTGYERPALEARAEEEALAALLAAFRQNPPPEMELPSLPPRPVLPAVPLPDRPDPSPPPLVSLLGGIAALAAPEGAPLFLSGIHAGALAGAERDYEARLERHRIASEEAARRHAEALEARDEEMRHQQMRAAYDWSRRQQRRQAAHDEADMRARLASARAMREGLGSLSQDVGAARGAELAMQGLAEMRARRMAEQEALARWMRDMMEMRQQSARLFSDILQKEQQSALALQLEEGRNRRAAEGREAALERVLLREQGLNRRAAEERQARINEIVTRYSLAARGSKEKERIARQIEGANREVERLLSLWADAERTKAQWYTAGGASSLEFKRAERHVRNVQDGLRRAKERRDAILRRHGLLPLLFDPATGRLEGAGGAGTEYDPATGQFR